MSSINPYMQPAQIISYDKANRTAQVSIAGLTDGANDGITAMLAYPIGDDDRDTERELIAGADVWVFFEQGDATMPVIAFYRRHGQGLATVDVRRIRQQNIEVLARANLTLSADKVVDIKAKTITLTGKIIIEGDIAHTGNQATNGSIAATGSIKSAGVSLSGHTHSGVKSGGDTTGKPN